jgi:putative membrane protein
MQLLLRWAISAAALYATIWILSLIPVGGRALADTGTGAWYGWFVAVIIMALVNALIRPILRLVAAPLNCLTFGLVGVLINALMFWLVPIITRAAGIAVFDVTFVGAIIGSILVGLIGGLASKMLIRDDEGER